MLSSTDYLKPKAKNAMKQSKIIVGIIAALTLNSLPASAESFTINDIIFISAGKDARDRFQQKKQICLLAKSRNFDRKNV